MIKIYTLIFSLLFATIAFSKVDCDKNPLYCRITSLHPNISKKFAMKVSNIIDKKSKKYKIDPYISIAIFSQESLFKNIHRYAEVILEKEICDEEQKCVLDYEIKRVIADVGIAQINPATIRQYKFNIKKLLDFDMDYTIDCHMKILKDKISMCKQLGNDAWSCYHSTSPRLRKEYKRLVERFMVD